MGGLGKQHFMTIIRPKNPLYHWLLKKQKIGGNLLVLDYVREIVFILYRTGFLD